MMKDTVRAARRLIAGSPHDEAISSSCGDVEFNFATLGFAGSFRLEMILIVNRFNLLLSGQIESPCVSVPP
jgi:hypothetical protein